MLCIYITRFQYFQGTLFPYKHVYPSNNFSILVRTEQPMNSKDSNKLEVELY